tara:strand:- start:39 stop:1277 length:1239 start_codon:yes stop_codon:yes gene_type:complete
MTNSGLTDLNDPDIKIETKVTTVNGKQIVEAVPPDETNTNTDGSSAEENNDFEYKILVNNEKITLNTDKYGASLVDKLQGHGIHIQQNGDMIILSGSGGKGKACGGRLLVNTKGGQLTKTGPVVVERRGSSKSPLQGSGSGTTEDNSSVALSEMNYGDVETETQGQHFIRAREIVLDATDTITLRANQVVIDTDDYRIGAGNIQESSDSKTESVTSQKNSEVKEDVERQYDTRSTKVTVGSGSISRRIRGDLKVWVAGVADMQFQGKVVGIPLIKNRTFGLNIGVNGEGFIGGLTVNANGMIDVSTNSENIILNSGKGIGIDAYAADNAPESGEVRISGSNKGVKMISWSGASEVNSTTVQATEDGVEITGKKKVEILAKTEGVSIKAQVKDVKVEAPAGNFDVQALKIYLN